MRALLMTLVLASAPPPADLADASESERFAVPRKGPYVADLTVDSAEIRWESSGGDSLVVGTGGSWSFTIPGVVVNDSMARAALDGLRPDTAYRYHVVLGGHRTAWQGFRTFPVAGSPVSFVVFGDTRSNHATHARIALRAAQESPDFVVNTGDLVGNGAREKQWQPFFEAERALLAVAPVFPAVGNHDATGLFNASFYERYFPHTRFYEKQAGAVRLFFLDTTQGYSEGSAQHTWLRERLAAARDEVNAGAKLWLLAVHHHPAWSSGHHGSEVAVQRELVPLYREYGVTAVFQGHDHLYERLESHGINYFVTGGGGAHLYESTGMPETKARAKAHHYLKVDADAEILKVRAIGLDGNVLDEVSFRRSERAEAPGRNAPFDRERRWPFAGPIGFLALAAAVAYFGSERIARR